MQHKQSQQQSEYNHQDHPQIHLCQMQLLPKQPYSYLFIPHQHAQIQQGIYNKITLQKLLKHIHNRFNDTGLVSTLIHRIYESSNFEVQFYVPELVYITIQKQNKQMRKVLVKKSCESESLRRLILWNLKAFTVLMKNKDMNIRQFVDNFQQVTDLQFQEIILTVDDKKQFQKAQKAISMLTTASLILKKMPKQELKDRLKKFIKRYNYEILNTLNHKIIIPFRSASQSEIFRSNLVARIVQDNCSCFPTRKRVPYRIILETIDPLQIKNHPNIILNRYNKKPQVDKPRDLYQQVNQQVEQIFKQKKMGSFLKQGQYPFVVDQQQVANIRQLNKFAKLIQNDEKQKQKEKQKVNKSSRRRTVLRKDTMKSKIDKSILLKNDYEIRDNQQLRKYDAIYIPTLPSSMRKSENDANSIKKNRKNNQHAMRWTTRFSDDENQEVIKVWEEEPKYNGIKSEQVWGEPWDHSIKKLKQNSPFRKFSSLRFHNVVIKGGDDLRQQIICMQMIYKIQAILKEANLDIFIKPYQIIVLSQNSGLLQFVANSISIDGMKKQRKMDLPQFYLEVFNTQSKFLQAKAKFIRSLAGSSILTYVLRLKDRHNGNILIDKDGNMIHIDFGFILGMSPGGLNFESSPFKLTEQYVILMGGKNSPDYNYFKDLFCSGMGALRKRCDEICLLLEIMMQGSDLDCFQNFNIESFKRRFQCDLSQEKFDNFCQGLVQKSCMNSRTVHYDTFQKLTNGIIP